MEELPVPTGLPAQQKSNKGRLYKWGGVGLAALIVFAVVTGDDDKPVEPAAVVQQPVLTTVAATTTTAVKQQSDDMIQLLAIKVVLKQNRDEICVLVRNLVNDDGLDLDVVVELALQMFKEGYDDKLIPEAEQLFRTSVRSCI